MTQDRNSAELVNTHSNPNLLINGDFSVWQRGEIFRELTAGGYVVDRWMATVTGDTATYQKGGAFGMPDKSPEHDYVNIIPTIHNGNLGIEQKIEKWQPILGKQLTFSCLVRPDEDIVVDVYGGFSGSPYTWAGADVVCKANMWTKVVITYTAQASMTDPVPDNAYYSISIRCKTPTLERFRFTECKLEYGSVSTPFIADDPATNLAKCQRYYQEVTGYHQQIQSAGTYGYCSWSCNMRVPPTVTGTHELSTADLSQSTMAGVRVNASTPVPSGQPWGSLKADAEL